MSPSMTPFRTLGVLTLLLGTTSVSAEEAFRPPETPSGRDRLAGIQVEYDGVIGPFLDSAKIRKTRKELCEGLGKPYLNAAPLGVDGKTRFISVQANGTSYMWTEMQRVLPEDPKDICRLVLKTLRHLTISRFDGTRTHETTYDYQQRAAYSRIAEGDVTAFSFVKEPVPFSSLPLVARRVLAGLECDERRILDVRGITQHSVCVSAPNPVSGWDTPLLLAREWTNPVFKKQATAVRPKVLVDPAIFQGPPGFSAPPVAPFPGIKNETNTDVDAEDDAEEGKATR